jgi:hypothetical protein
MSHQLYLSLSITNATATVYINLQHLAHNHISISYGSLLSPSQHHYSKLNHFKIYFVDNEFKKTN